MSRTFIFIGGVEGSGTTLLLRLLSSPIGCASLGGNYQKLPDHPDATSLADAFLAANRAVWNRKLSFEEHEAGRINQRAAMYRILTAKAFEDTACYFLKRSFPFGEPRDQFTPDLWDILDFWPEVRVIVIYRDPRAATYSAFRRKFDSDLRRLAVVCGEQLTWLAAQVRAIGLERVRIVSYSRLGVDPVGTLEPLADFCGVNVDEVKEAVSLEDLDSRADMRWIEELSSRDSKWLNDFFDDKRRVQWQVLESEPT